MSKLIHDSYTTDGSNNQVSIQVQTGYAQTYSTSVTVDGNPVVIAPLADSNGIYADDFSIPIGTNSSLKNALLEVTTYAYINMAPPTSSVIIDLTGGAAPKSFVMSDAGTGANPGDTIQYYASIALI